VIFDLLPGPVSLFRSGWVGDFPHTNQLPSLYIHRLAYDDLMPYSVTNINSITIMSLLEHLALDSYVARFRTNQVSNPYHGTIIRVLELPRNILAGFSAHDIQEIYNLLCTNKIARIDSSYY
jgi:hypothetical protein